MAIIPHDNVQYHPVIGGITVVSVGLPVAGADVNLDVALENPPTDNDDCIPDVGPVSIIHSPRIENCHRLTVHRGQRHTTLDPVLPETDNLALRKESDRPFMGHS